jgi:hypothetical protein
MFVGVKRFLTAVGINDVAMFVAVGLSADVTAGASTDVAVGNTDVAVGANVEAKLVAEATEGIVEVTVGLSKPAVLAALGVPAPIAKSVAVNAAI